MRKSYRYRNCYEKKLKVQEYLPDEVGEVKRYNGGRGEKEKIEEVASKLEEPRDTWREEKGEEDYAKYENEHQDQGNKEKNIETKEGEENEGYEEEFEKETMIEGDEYEQEEAASR